MMRMLSSSRLASTRSAGVVRSAVLIPARYRAPRETASGRGYSPHVDAPWLRDACGLVDAFRAGELSPLKALDASIAAIEVSPLNAFSFTDFDRARESASRADVSLPFGGVPFGIKELE